MTYRILLCKEPTNGYIATALDWPKCKVSAPTRGEALAQMQNAISLLLISGEIIDLEVPTPLVAAPYTEAVGLFRDDLTFAEFVEEVKQYRNERNQEAL